MRNFFIFLTALLIFLSYKSHAQLKPAEGQYSVSAGAFINPSFEQGYKGWTVTGCTKSLEADVPYLNNTLKLACTAETFSIKQEVTSLVGLEGNQGLLSCRVKATAPGVRVRSLTNGVETSSIEVVSGLYKKIEIPTVIGDTSNGNEILVDSNYTGDVFIDECIFSPAPAGYLQKVSGAMFVGSLTYNQVSCIWQNTATSWGVFPANANCATATNVIGEVTAPATAIPAIKVLNARTDGHYKVTAQGLLYSQGTVNTCRYSLSSTGSFDNQGTAYIDSNATSYNNLTGNFKFSTGGDKEIEIMSERVAGASNCEVYGSDSYQMKFTVHFFPDSASLLAVQNKELTAKTENELSANISGSGFMVSENYDFISSCSVESPARIKCLFNSIGLTVAPVCGATINKDDGTTDKDKSSSTYTSTTYFETLIEDTGSLSPVASDFSIQCSKQGADVNKSQVITGTFDSQKWECETQYLSALSNTVGVKSDLTTTTAIGKKYFTWGGTVSEANASFTISNNSVDIGRGGTSFSSYRSICYTAAATTTLITQDNTNIIYGNGTATNTWVETCKLPDNYECN